MKDSHIQWTTHTFNPWIGCTKVSPGCQHCYAEALNKRWKGGANWGKGAPRNRTSASNWREPLKWNRDAKGERPRVFCASLADWLDDEVEIRWLADLMKLIVETPNLDWLLLTKRPQNWKARINAGYMHTACGSVGADEMMFNWEENGIAPDNVWIGTTVEDEERGYLRHAALMDIPARVHFWSAEPLLSAIDASVMWAARGAPDWVIVGGESGAQAREMQVKWARDLRDQCRANPLPGNRPSFFMKQMGGARDKRGELAQIPEDLRIREFPLP